jgi:hypothetical protein
MKRPDAIGNAPACFNGGPKGAETDRGHEFVHSVKPAAEPPAFAFEKGF